MKIGLTAALAAGTALTMVPAGAAAQRQAPPSPEQRLDRLEKQVQQMQRQVFPKGRPADTAGFADDPAATQSSVVSLDQRIDALEHQVADLVRQSEENGNRLRKIESGMAQLKADEDQRIAALEQRMSEAVAAPAAAAPVETAPATTTPPRPRPAPAKVPPKKAADAQPAPAEGGPAAETAAAGDPGEDAYTDGFHLWQAGQYDQAITALKAFVAAYPRHRRVSYANNLIGRSLLSKGLTRDAAMVFLANYRDNPGGERAADSLYYLGEATIQLGQADHACNVFAEFDAIYGSKARTDLKKQVADAKAKAHCS